MPQISLLFCLLAILLLGGAAKEKSKTPPSFKLTCAQGKTPEKCLNQPVTLEAKMAGFDPESAREILQHPDMRSPIGNWHQYQTVISSNLGQVNILTETEIACPNVKIQGILSEFSLNCEPGQKGKCEYRSYVVHLKSFTCQK